MKYLAAVDLSDASLLALDALRASAGEGGGDVTLLHVVDLDPYTAGGSVPGIMEFARERLTQESERLANCGLRVVAIRVEQGDSTQTILRVAAEEHVDLVVMTHLGKGARTGRLFGSTAERVASAGTVPVLIERVHVKYGDGAACCRVVESSPFARVLVGVDLEHDGRTLISALDWIPGVTTVRIAHAVRNASDVDTAAARLAELTGFSSAGSEIDHRVLVGEPAEALLAEATSWGATVIVLSPCAHGVLHRAVWGSVAREVASDARCSILFVPPRIAG